MIKDLPAHQLIRLSGPDGILPAGQAMGLHRLLKRIFADAHIKEYTGKAPVAPGKHCLRQHPFGTIDLEAYVGKFINHASKIPDFLL